VFSSKLQKTFAKIEQKILDMNDAKYKMSQNEMVDLEDLNDMHLNIKRKYEIIMEHT